MHNNRLLVIDIVLPGMNGLEFLATIKTRRPDPEVIIMTSQASVDTAEALSALAIEPVTT